MQLDEQVFAAKKRLADEEQKLQDQIIKAEETYQKAVEGRTQTIYNSFGLFDELKKKEEVSSDTLKANLKDQVKELEDWSKNLQTLTEKGVDKGE